MHNILIERFLTRRALHYHTSNNIQAVLGGFQLVCYLYCKDVIDTNPNHGKQMRLSEQLSMSAYSHEPIFNFDKITSEKHNSRPFPIQVQ